MSQIFRLKETEITNGHLINADDLNAEFNQLVSESNVQDNRLVAMETGAITLSGVKTFNTPPKMNQIDEGTTGAGVRVDGVYCRDGVINSRPCIATISSIDIAADQITTTSAHGLNTQDSVSILSGTAAGSLPGGISESTVYFARVLSPTSFSLHPTPDDAGLGNLKINITTAGSGTLYVLHDLPTPKTGDVWVDQEGALKYRANSTTYLVSDKLGRHLNRLESFSAAPVYSSSTTISIKNIASRDATDSTNIIQDNPMTINITGTNLNGIVQTNVNGTISITNGSTSVTVIGGTGEFIVGDVLVTQGGQTRKVTAVDGNQNPSQVDLAWSTSESNVAFKRGGRLANTWYYAYEVIASNGGVGVMLSTRNASGGQVLDFWPTAWRQMKFALRLDASANIMPFYMTGHTSGTPKIIYNIDMTGYTAYSAGTNTVTVGPTCVLNAGTATTFTTCSLSNFVPAISRLAVIHHLNGGPGQVSLREAGSSLNVGLQVGCNNGNEANQYSQTYLDVRISASQQIEYKRMVGSPHYLDVLGYYVTEVP